MCSHTIRVVELVGEATQVIITVLSLGEVQVAEASHWLGTIRPVWLEVNIWLLAWQASLCFLVRFVVIIENV